MNESDASTLAGKSYVITGANSGLGLACATQLAARGGKVILACRDADKGERARRDILASNPQAEVRVTALDLASLDSIRRCAEQLQAREPSLTALINNAGVMTPPLERTVDGFELQFGINVLGHFALTGLLLPLLQAARGARVVSVSSVGHWAGRIRFDNLNAERGYGKASAYNQSKLCNLVFAYELQRRLEHARLPIISVAAHPGITRSALARHSTMSLIVMKLVAQSAQEGARSIVMAATDDAVHGGAYVGPGGFLTVKGKPTLQGSSRRSKDADLGARLWDSLERMSGVRCPS